VISIENESLEDSHITINDINIIEDLNTAQIDNDAATGREAIENKMMTNGEQHPTTTGTTKDQYLPREITNTPYYKVVNSQLLWQYQSHMCTS